MSRADRPKQLIALPSGKSLLQLADNRLTGLIDPAQRYICTGERYHNQIVAALPHYAADHIIGEPAVRDTVNAIGLCAAILCRDDPEAVLAVLTSDHVIDPTDRFHAALSTGYQLVEADRSRLVTFAIQPTFPATGYGYVERGKTIDGFRDAYEAQRFVEKPDEQTAQSYLARGGFGWNSGMFVYAAETFMECLRRFLPESFDGLTAIAQAWGSPDQDRVLDEVYPILPKISVDYAVMEPAGGDDALSICIVDMDVRWLDVGSWPAFAEMIEPDSAGNCVSCKHEALLLGASNTLVVSDDPSHTVAVIGVKDLIVVHTRDATLVCPKDQAQRVKEACERASTMSG